MTVIAILSIVDSKAQIKEPQSPYNNQNNSSPNQDQQIAYPGNPNSRNEYESFKNEEASNTRTAWRFVPSRRLVVALT